MVWYSNSISVVVVARVVVVVEVDLAVVVDLLEVVVVVVEVVVEALEVVDVDTETEVLPFNASLSIIVELNSGGDEGDVCDLNVCLLVCKTKSKKYDQRLKKRKRLPRGKNPAHW